MNEALQGGRIMSRHPCVSLQAERYILVIPRLVLSLSFKTLPLSPLAVSLGKRPA